MGTPYRPPSAGTAETMALVGVIFQLIFALFFLLVLGALGLAAAVALSSVGYGGLAFVYASIWLVFGLIGFILLWLGYDRVYKRIKAGEYDPAHSTALVLTIILFVTLQILPAIFYLIAYIKLGDAINEMRNPPQYGGQPMYMTQPPMAQQPAWGQSPPMASPSPQPAAPPMVAAAPAQAPVCPRCGKPATWVAQYGRYYCYTDAQYL